MRSLPWTWKLVPAKSSRKIRPWQHVETLEPRQLLTVQIQFDYSQDENGFFDDPERRAVLEFAAQSVVSQLHDELAGISPDADNSWSIDFTNPSNSGRVTINNPTISENTLVVFVGARDISALAFAGPGSYSASGSDEWLDLVMSRGQVGTFASPATDFAPWGGSITFDADRNWHFGVTTDGLGSNEHDFFSVAAHELGHVLGIGTSDSWERFVTGRVFTPTFSGAHTVAEYDVGSAKVPLHDYAHFDEGLKEGDQEVAMDPSIRAGTRKPFTALDFAALADIGWEVDAAIGGNPPDEPEPESLPATYEISVPTGVAHQLVIRDDGDSTNHRMQVVLDGVAMSFLIPTDEIIIRGGSKNDTITIQSLDPEFSGKITVFAGAGHDRVNATAISAALQMYGEDGRDTLLGGSGDDSLFGGADRDSLNGGAGHDLLFGEASRDTLSGGVGNDTLDGGGDRDTLLGQSGNDELHGGLGDDSLNGHDGDDTLLGDAGNDKLRGGNGDDGLSGDLGNDSLFGEDGLDTLLGGSGNDSLRGGAGNDLLQGGAGSDRLAGDADTDTLSGGEGSGRDRGDSFVSTKGDVIDELFSFNVPWLELEA